MLWLINEVVDQNYLLCVQEYSMIALQALLPQILQNVEILQ